MQASRSKAIMSNTNSGVFFAIVDANSYRWVMADNPAGEASEQRFDEKEGQNPLGPHP